MLGFTHPTGYADPMANEDPHRWSRHVTETSHALRLEDGVFTWDDPARIAASLRRSAEQSTARKGTPYQSAMSMLTFYINRAGDGLPDDRRAVLEQAKVELRALFGKKKTRPTGSAGS